MLRAYFGHHKCASTWIWEIIQRVTWDAGLRSRIILDPQTPSGKGPLTDYQSEFSRSNLGNYVRSERLDFVSCITADMSQAQSLHDTLGFHVIRDPRDIIVSGYFSHRNTHPTGGLPHLAAHRKRLQSVPIEEGLQLEMDFSSPLIEDMASWDYNQPNILEVKMEDLTRAPYETFVEIFEFLGLMSWEGETLMRNRIQVFLQSALNRLSLRHPWLDLLRSSIEVTGSMLLGHVYDQRFEKKAGGRRKGVENRRSHYRKGKAGDWTNHFSQAHIDYFNDRFGDALIRLGYESSTRWNHLLSGDGTSRSWECFSLAPNQSSTK
jgi:hypothetical protein